MAIAFVTWSATFPLLRVSALVFLYGYFVAISFLIRFVTSNASPTFHISNTFRAKFAGGFVCVRTSFGSFGITNNGRFAITAFACALKVFFQNGTRKSLLGPLIASKAIAFFFRQFIVARDVVHFALASETVTTILFLQRFAAVVFLVTPVVAGLFYASLGTLLFPTRNRFFGFVIKTEFRSVKSGRATVFAAVLY